ncbi:Crp/Fnr family transcriptional regulator [Stenotrophomonas sp. 24(2023)]|uniref:Crp/Fnr family transcriptional regulator n=1 Tax=Stenotrophomonas sp. 24(2023) TaxID=3068324 RepID=UPI0027E0031B|nr:Crp/Fnr family transcriptional regulator [Stenotrophomonas sp. 24(2023)]WMJ71222.1 Crp/Fnr family transcriptional regulator [Stenotrophomonas sp. 24(2023)]
MTQVDEAVARVCAHGWLSEQPSQFCARVVERLRVLDFQAGDFIYRRGDPLGGIYGLVSGVVAVDIAPPGEPGRLVQYGIPGAWTGEGCFLTRQPRRLDLRACGPVRVVHLPLAAMDELVQQDPAAHGCFAQIMMANVYVLLRIVHDLQIVDVDKRIASTTARLHVPGADALPISQTELGRLANASRRQVAAAFRRFAAQGWLTTTYRSVRVDDAAALAGFAVSED